MTLMKSHPAADTLPIEAVSPAASAHGAHGPYETDTQRRRAAKLGMWIFLGSEIMMFSGLFCLYAICRTLHPEVFQYGSQFLDRNLGLANTIILLWSSFTMALAVTSAQRRQWRWVMIGLALTLACGLAFLGIKAVEYQHKFHKGLLWGDRFTPPAPAVVVTEAAPPPDPMAQVPMELRGGFRLYTRTCAPCHGKQGEGLSGAGVRLAGTDFFKKRTNEELVAFIKEGRAASDPQSITRQLMPPNGGNPRLSDADLTQIVRYLRSLEPAPAPEGEPVAQDHSQPIRTLFPVGNPGPQGLSPEMFDGPANLSFASSGPGKEHDAADPSAAPRQAYLFFSLYFLTTGLHALHMTIGLGVIIHLMVRVLRKRRDDLPIEITGLYWHLVDIIWIIVFPLYYLIH